MVNFKLISIDGIKFEGEVYEVVLPTQSGEIAIFKDHMPLISSAGAGLIKIRHQAGDSDAQMSQFASDGGLIEVDGHSVNYLADDITAEDEINEAEAQAAVELAQKRLASAKDKVELSEAQRLLARGNARLQLSKLKKRHHN